MSRPCELVSGREGGCARRGDVVYHPEITVRWAYDLKPCGVVSYEFSNCGRGIQRTSMMISVTLMVTGLAWS